ncbi:YhcB family protein [Nitrogeniibacter aestuarii]|uniref:YhcB family protein n=1 Tax=Nitrogeniibacter aestuarii TaxID=2815343 RepID=UPI001E2EAC03|nr:DUF1043 family protein [Nitrogeniibacter aestuarii]
MVDEAMWPAIIVAALVSLFVGFLIGRFAGGPRRKADQLAAELEEKRAETERYRNEVDAHFDKTATLFVSMAGSYKDLFEHLSTGYEKLSDKSARDVFRERVDAMLVGSSLEHKMITEETPEPAVPATENETAADAPEAAEAPTPVAEDATADQGAPAMPDGEPMVGAEPVQAKDEVSKQG